MIKIDKKDFPSDEQIGKDIGKYSFIVENEEIKKIYGRDDIRLKVFKVADDSLETALWGSTTPNLSNLRESTIIQNIFSFFNLAPRVYDLILVDDGEFKHPAQVIEYLKGRKGVSLETLRTMEEVCDTRYIEMLCDIRPENFINNKLVDFQGASFINFDLYKEELFQKAHTTTHWAVSNTSYQSIPGIGVEGRRNTEYRIKQLGLDKIDFKGKTVLDVGCSGGVFCQYAIDRGAKRVVGIDLPSLTATAKRIANLLGYWNIDFYGMDLLDTDYKDILNATGIGSFDIVLYLSMGYHIHYPKFLETISADLVLFEGNQRETDDEGVEYFSKWCNLEKKLKNTTDLLDRPVYWFRRKDGDK